MREFKKNTSVEFAKNQKLDELLATLNPAVSSAELSFIQRYSLPQWPIIFVVGAPRSGSTLFMQWLVSLQQWAYPSNFLSRFPQAPCLAALIQRMLFESEYHYKSEFCDLNPHQPDFSSDLGKTSGVLGQNSFMHFWRHHFPFEAGDFLPVDKLKDYNCDDLLRTFAGLEQVFQKPICMKARLMNFHLDYLSQKVPGSIYIYLKREKISHAYSILQARRRLYGTDKEWFSQRVEPFEILRNCTPYEQVVAQISRIETAVLSVLQGLPQARCLIVDLDEFRAQPQAVYEQIRLKYLTLGTSLQSVYKGVQSFDKPAHAIPRAERLKIQAAWENLKEIKFDAT